jgi:hypothetical protein
MGTELLTLCFAVGAVLLAVWCRLRWPGLTPQSHRSLLIHVFGAFMLLRVLLATPDAALSAPRLLAISLVVVIVVGALTYAFLTTLWLLQALTDALRGMA